MPLCGLSRNLFHHSLHLMTLAGRFQRLPPARGGTAQKKIIHMANWSQLIHPGPASSLTKVFLLSSKSCVNAYSLLIRAAATSTSGTLNDLTTDLIMANNNSNFSWEGSRLYT